MSADNDTMALRWYADGDDALVAGAAVAVYVLQPTCSASSDSSWDSMVRMPCTPTTRAREASSSLFRYSSEGKEDAAALLAEWLASSAALCFLMTMFRKHC